MADQEVPLGYGCPFCRVGPGEPCTTGQHTPIPLPPERSAGPPMTLKEQTRRRLTLAGITPTDRALRWIRDWNRIIYQRDREATDAPVT